MTKDWDKPRPPPAPRIERDPDRAAAIAELQRAQASINRAREYLMGPTEHVTVNGAESVGKHYREPPPPPDTLGVTRDFSTPHKWPWQREFWR